jgi:hypothetical protein
MRNLAMRIYSLYSINVKILTGLLGSTVQDASGDFGGIVEFFLSSKLASVIDACTYPHLRCASFIFTVKLVLDENGKVSEEFS